MVNVGMNHVNRSDSSHAVQGNDHSEVDLNPPSGTAKKLKTDVNQLSSATDNTTNSKVGDRLVECAV